VTETCLDCGREIKGPMIQLPDGDAYHYGCVGVEYPEPCGTDQLLDALDEEDSPLYDFLKFMDENPYINMLEALEKAPANRIQVKQRKSVKAFGREVVSWKKNNTTGNINPMLLQAMAFGFAMERDYPAFADRDDVYPRGEARVPVEEEEVEESGN